MVAGLAGAGAGVNAGPFLALLMLRTGAKAVYLRMLAGEETCEVSLFLAGDLVVVGMIEPEDWQQPDRLIEEIAAHVMAQAAA